MARSRYIYIWTTGDGIILGAFTVKSEAIANEIVQWLPDDDCDLHRHYDGSVTGAIWHSSPVLVATKRGVVVTETKQSWRPRNE